jgi:hypothetical protein
VAFRVTSNATLVVFRRAGGPAVRGFGGSGGRRFGGSAVRGVGRWYSKATGASPSRLLLLLPPPEPPDPRTPEPPVRLGFYANLEMSCARESTPTLLKIRLRCFFAVVGAMSSAVAMSRFP